MATDPIAIDLSHWNTVKDFAAVKASGVIAAIHKATQGTGYVDPDYAKRRRQASDAGLAWASYHYLEHGKVIEQIDHYLDVAEPDPGERVVIDYEAENCVLDDLRSAVRELETHPGLQITVYSGHLVKDQLGGGYDKDLAETSLWLAQYGATASWPKGTWNTWSLWQYSDKGKVPGIDGNVDVNRFNGSDENAALWFGIGAPAPAPEGAVVRVAIDLPDGVSIEISVNGDVIAGGRY